MLAKIEANISAMRVILTTPFSVTHVVGCIGLPTKKLCRISIASALSLVLCGCQGLRSGSGTIQSVNHIIVMTQENRSLDTYFGQLPAYWAANGFPSQQFDGLPANASNPAYNGTTTPGSATVSAFHMATECMENLSPSWDESHEDWNLQDPTSSTALMNGFVYNAAKFAIDENSEERTRLIAILKASALWATTTGRT